MSQENVEIVRNGIDAYNRKDLDAVLEHGTLDFEFVEMSALRDAGFDEIECFWRREFCAILCGLRPR